MIIDDGLRSTADQIGLDPKICGYDQTVVLLCLAKHAEAVAEDRRQEPASVGGIGGLSRIYLDDLVKGPLAKLVKAGYATAEEYPAADWAGLDGPAGYRITEEGQNALAAPLRALRALPDSIDENLRGAFFEKAGRTSGPA